MFDHFTIPNGEIAVLEQWITTQAAHGNGDVLDVEFLLRAADRAFLDMCRYQQMSRVFVVAEAAAADELVLEQVADDVLVLQAGGAVGLSVSGLVLDVLTSLVQGHIADGVIIVQLRKAL